MMNKARAILIFLALLFVAEGAYAQTDSLQNLPNLLLPKFITSVVRMKSGEKRKAVLNYNIVDQEMVFMQRDQFFVLDDPQLIDTVYMANRAFIPFEKGFYELAVRGPVTLFIQHKAYVESVGVPTGYGAMSQTTSYNYVKAVYDNNGAINLKLPEEFKITDDTEYWVLKDGAMKNFDTRRQFLQIFPEQGKELKQYLVKTKLDFNDYQAVIKLVEYCNTIL